MRRDGIRNASFSRPSDHIHVNGIWSRPVRLRACLFSKSCFLVTLLSFTPHLSNYYLSKINGRIPQASSKSAVFSFSPGSLVRCEFCCGLVWSGNERTHEFPIYTSHALHQHHPTHPIPILASGCIPEVP